MNLGSVSQKAASTTWSFCTGCFLAIVVGFDWGISGAISWLDVSFHRARVPFPQFIKAAKL